MMYPIGTYAYQSIADHGEMACFAALAENLGSVQVQVTLARWDGIF